MNIQEFLEHLKKTPRHWTDIGALRLQVDVLSSHSECDCPLTAVARLVLPSWPAYKTCGYPIEAGEALGLTEEDIRWIFDAADDQYHIFHAKLRAACLE